MINSNPPQRLVKHIIRSYARLAENNRVRAVLRENLPSTIKDKNFYRNLDDSSKRWLQNLMKQLSNTNMNISMLNNNIPMGNINNIGMNNMPINIPIGINPINPNNDYNYNDNFDNGKAINMNYALNNNLKQNYMNMNNAFMYKNGK
jgi:hypothetical protein